MIDISTVREQLLALPNVVGVGVGYKVRGGEIVRDDNGDPIECIVVSVTEKLPLTRLRAEDIVPESVAGEPTDVIQTGVITVVANLPDGAAAAAVDPTQRLRPITPGLSIGLNPGVTAGTLGFFVQRPGSSTRYLLSNWHVIAADNTPVAEREVLTITQPGNADGGRVPADVVARLAGFVPITSGGLPIPDPSDCTVAATIAWLPNLIARAAGSATRLLPVVEVTAEGDNLVDAAIGLVEAESDRTTPEIGVVTETDVPALGMQVQKYGRTTRHTVGTITQVNATFRVQGYPGGIATFVDQVAVTADGGSFLEGGDSGSGLTTVDGKAVGLCFAGSTEIGIANTWQNVEAALEVIPARE